MDEADRAVSHEGVPALYFPSLMWREREDPVCLRFRSLG